MKKLLFLLMFPCVGYCQFSSDEKIEMPDYYDGTWVHDSQGQTLLKVHRRVPFCPKCKKGTTRDEVIKNVSSLTNDMLYPVYKTVRKYDAQGSVIPPVRPKTYFRCTVCDTLYDFESGYLPEKNK